MYFFSMAMAIQSRQSTMTTTTPAFRKIFLQFIFFFFFFFHQTNCSAVEVMRPRGVSLTKATFYDPSRDFTCLDGSVTIPFRYVNDDYCDCEDGTDEPGTAACPNGVFHCTNAGHKPINIPSSRVNDGICDCCDASDEFNSSANCANFCKELGRKAREEAQMQLELVIKGFEIKQELIKKGKELKEDRMSKIKELEREENELVAIKTEKEEVKTKAEELEKAAVDKFRQEEEERKTAEEEKRKSEEDKIKAEELERRSMAAFIELDVDSNGKLTLDEIKGKWMFDRNKDGEVTDEEAKHFLLDKEEMEFEEFKNSAWSLVKPQFALQGMFTPPEEEEIISATPSVETEEAANIQPDSVEDVYRDDFKEPGDEEVDEEEEEEEEDRYRGFQKPDFSDLTKDLTPPTPAPEPEVEKTPFDEETQALVDAAENARKEFREAENKVNEVKSEISKMKRFLEIDFGSEGEFSSFYDQCVDYTDREYTYSLCFFDRVTQKPKSDGSPINLGLWDRWIGQENDKYSRMKFENGLGCWNGPSRSTEVRLTCAPKNELIRVHEPERCKYLFEATSPAVCAQPNNKQTDLHAHEEL